MPFLSIFSILLIKELYSDGALVFVSILFVYKIYIDTISEPHLIILHDKRQKKKTKNISTKFDCNRKNNFFFIFLLQKTDMDDDCYPVITMTARHLIQSHNSSNSVQSVCSTNDSSSISSSDIDVDDSNVKEEPLSPSSSSPPSPAATSYEINSNLAKMAAYTNTDLVFEHKVREI